MQEIGINQNKKTIGSNNMTRKRPEKKYGLDRLKSAQELINTDNVMLFQILDEMNERLNHIETFLLDEIGHYKKY